ncbi:hypothetical protein BU26DRAFT_516314 [Trematosphaeria pertusa]|uniref:Uncharacterized protein n=1 Tax=Trematosphaeria pertusa TaxID=390896 RepID=A0A6A6IU46_9PLEO|nr:uncharacterized protein BU26DRAFT_516314 [Trematosphaeria pertusa]KAF2254075.1 hypothetical protein BU26DRAFT_516314 [Trematosphaeria pertusa]
MDPESFESDLRNLRCTEETEVQYFDSREAAAGDSVLNEQELLSKIPSIVRKILGYTDMY